MFHLATKLPHSCDVAFSGGVDSLAASHFLLQGKKDIRLLHFNHGCMFSDRIEKGCQAHADALGLPMIVGRVEGIRKDGQSLEDFWRRERYKFLWANTRETFMTCHHLDDAVETWVWSSMHGNGKIIPKEFHREGKILLRPFLLTKKDELIKYAERHNLIPVHDPYNNDRHLTRNYIRANMMTHVRYVNPGIDKVIRKKYLNGERNDNAEKDQ